MSKKKEQDLNEQGLKDVQVAKTNLDDNLPARFALQH